VDYSRFRMPDFRSIPRRDYLIAAVSGGLLALSFPKTGFSLLTWIAFVPLLLVTGQKSPLKAGKLGFVAGLAAYGGILYWINIAVTTYGKLPLAVSLIVYTILVAYLAGFWGFLLYLVRWCEQRGIPVLLSFPCLWVGLEFIRSFLFTGFPWASLGYTQYRLLPLIQMADITGVYGLSYLIAFTNVIVYLFIKAFVKNEGKASYPVKGTVALLVMVILALAYGFFQLRLKPAGVPLTIALVQGSIDQSKKWDPAFQDATITIYDRLTRQAAAGGVDLVVWPESAVPFLFQDGQPQALRIPALAARIRSTIVFGSPAYEKREGKVTFLNSAFLVSSTGKVIGRSDKVHLVPFGEYVPLKGMLPFVNKLVEGVGDFSPGSSITPLDAGKFKFGVLVCYEGIFPELSREYVQSGADLLVNITNDAWYGRSSAPYQHLSMAVFRAIENRVPLVRAANTGITAVIDRNGRIVRQTGLFEEAFLREQVMKGNAGSIYTTIGDAFAILCLVLSAGFVVVGFTRLALKWGRKESPLTVY
jgi:apolipoprotein N-acyltransferase